MRTCVVLLVIVAGCAAGTPPPAIATPTPTPSSTIAELAYFVGNWQADVVNPTTNKKFQLVYRVAPTLRGAWLAGNGVAAALDLEIHDLWGKDPITGEIIRTIFDSSGVTGTVRSKGWTGNILIFEGEAVAPGTRLTVRETIERRSDDEFHARWESKTDETWTAYSIEQLRRLR